MAQRLTREAKKLKRELKAINTRIASLYKQAQRTGDFTVYDNYTAHLQNLANNGSQIVHRTDYGAVQLSQNPKNYQNRHNKTIKNIASKVPTITKIKRIVKTKTGYSDLTADEAIAVLRDITNLDSIFSQKYQIIDEMYTNDEMRQYFPELYTKTSHRRSYDEWRAFADAFIAKVEELEEGGLDATSTRKIPFVDGGEE